LVNIRDVIYLLSLETVRLISMSLPPSGNMYKIGNSVLMGMSCSMISLYIWRYYNILMGTSC